MSAPHCGSKCIGVIETEDVLAVINQQIEVAEEVFAEDATDSSIRGSELRDLLDDGEGMGHRAMPPFQGIKVSERVAGRCSNTLNASCALNLQPQIEG